MKIYDEQNATWRDDVLHDVQGEYQEATPLNTGETTGNLIIELQPGTVFKVLSPDRAPFLPYEKRLWVTLAERFGDDGTGIFLPQESVTIAGRGGFTSQRFTATLLDVILQPDTDTNHVAATLGVGLDAAFALFGAERERTLGERDPRFPEELRLTCQHIADEVYQDQVYPGGRLRQIAAQVERFMPSEGCWCHRDVHLDNVATLEGKWLLFDPIPTLEQRPEYVEKVRHLEPPLPGHVFLDYAKLLISLEREAGKLDHANWDHERIREDRRAALDRDTQTERRNLLLHLKREYETKAETEVGRTALRLGYVIYYGLYSACPCDPCTIWGIKETMIAGLGRTINQLLADE